MNLETNNSKIALPLQRKPMVALLACFCCFLWGSAFPSIKIGYQLFQIDSADTGSQILFAGFRFALAGILVILFMTLIQKKFLTLRKSTAPKAAALCMVQTVLQYLFFYIGLAHASGTTSSIVTASNVFFAILAASCLFHMEPLGKKKLLGCLIGFLGVIIVNLGNNSGAVHMSLDGEGLILCSAISAAFSSVISKYFSRTEDPIALSGYQFLFGGIILSMIGFFMGGHVSTSHFTGVLLLLYLAFVSATAYTIWAILLKYNPVGNVSVYGFTNPICGVILSSLLLHETGAFHMSTIAALVLVCIGIWVVNKE